MAGYNTKNYEQQGGAVWVVGGELQVASGAKITNAGTQAVVISAQKVNYATTDLDTEAEIIVAINATNTALNAVIAALKGAGIVASA